MPIIACDEVLDGTGGSDTEMITPYEVSWKIVFRGV